MGSPDRLEQFLEDIMHITVLRMGGASAGIVGSTGADSEVLNNLKKTSLAFAAEYRKSGGNHSGLSGLTQQIEGQLRTLQLTATLSSKETDKLIDELHQLSGSLA